MLEIYKLHAELADRVSQRREGANRLFVSLLTGIILLCVAFTRFGTGEVPLDIMLLAVSFIGAALTVAWYIVIRSYRQLNTGKFKALGELEDKLAYPFFRREWELLEQGKDINRYWKLTVVETCLPIVFFIVFFAVMCWSLLSVLGLTG